MSGLFVPVNAAGAGGGGGVTSYEEAVFADSPAVYADGPGLVLARSTLGVNAGIPALNVAAISGECWFTTTTAGTASLIDRDSQASNRQFQFRLNAGKLEVITFPGPTVTATTASYNDGVLHHAVFTYQGTTLVIYVDGTAVKTVSYTSSLATGDTNPFWIGWSGGSFQTYVGTVLRRCAAYPSALSAARVAAHFAAG